MDREERLKKMQIAFIKKYPGDMKRFEKILEKIKSDDWLKKRREEELEKRRNSPPPVRRCCDGKPIYEIVYHEVESSVPATIYHVCKKHFMENTAFQRNPRTIREIKSKPKKATAKKTTKKKKTEQYIKLSKMPRRNKTD